MAEKEKLLEQLASMGVKFDGERFHQGHESFGNMDIDRAIAFLISSLAGVEGSIDFNGIVKAFDRKIEILSGQSVDRTVVKPEYIEALGFRYHTGSGAIRTPENHIALLGFGPGQVMEYMMLNPKKIILSGQFYRYVDYPYDTDPGLLRMWINRLRTGINDTPIIGIGPDGKPTRDFHWIHTVRGSGYIFSDEKPRKLRT